MLINIILLCCVLALLYRYRSFLGRKKFRPDEMAFSRMMKDIDCSVEVPNCKTRRNKVSAVLKIVKSGDAKISGTEDEDQPKTHDVIAKDAENCKIHFDQKDRKNLIRICVLNNILLSQFLTLVTDSLEKLIDSYSSGDISGLKANISRPIFSRLLDSINEKTENKEREIIILIKLREIRIIKAMIEKDSCLIKVGFVSEQINYIEDCNKKVIKGDKHKSFLVSEAWTFEKNIKKKKEGEWVLSAMELVDKTDE